MNSFYSGFARKLQTMHSHLVGEENQEKPPKVTFMENFREYCLNTTIHGFKYVGTVGLSVFERTFFAISFLLVSILSIYFISSVYQKWQSTPIIIGLNPIATHIRDIPFPAVTICNMNQARRTAAERIAPNSLEHAMLESICSLDGEYNATNYEGKWSNVQKTLLNATQPCHRMIQACRYAQKVQRCIHMFQPVLTDEGLCCTFNNVDPAYMMQHTDITARQPEASENPFEPIEWTPEGGYKGKPRNTTYPRAIAGTGTNMGLTVILDANVSDYFCSSTSSYGFKLLLHNPTETPKMAEYAQYIQVGTENRIIVNPKISDASYLIRKVAQAQRQCVFANEANLSYFRTYSRNNCEMECEARLIQENCGCVLYYMPKLREDTKICSKADAGCYEEIKSSIALTANTSLMCSCLPGCFEISYSMYLTTAELCIGKFKIREKLLTQNDSYARANIALVYIFFSDTYFRSFTKGELVGFTDFLSNIGGLLGLFMGFSLISLAEVFYFITLRPLFAKRREQKERSHRDKMRNREMNIIYNNVFQIVQKPQQVYGNDDTSPVSDMPRQVETFLNVQFKKISKWITDVLHLRNGTVDSRNRSTFPFYE
ncbi:pickpocket protein 28 [Toxorhynchites rutilus septentrionalis]|uniref:pickpocket protein 28 n=1 Tax=Toxorhynchites rutilus septentrionalis TaxID=329112 RepID=UPI00247964A2|nr:pickpocket protein 28 [Toxorhynchites rutilus septentrionalis]